MVPTSFDEANAVLSKPQSMTHEQCSCLAVMRGETEISKEPVVVSCWKLTREELDEVNRTGRVWLTVFGQGMPPATLDGIRPF